MGETPHRLFLLLGPPRNPEHWVPEETAGLAYAIRPVTLGVGHRRPLAFLPPSQRPPLGGRGAGTTFVCSEDQKVQSLEHMHLLHGQSPVKHWH